MSFWDDIIGAVNAKGSQKSFSEEEHAAFKEIMEGFQDASDTIWAPQPYVMKSFDDFKKEKKPENCRNCGSAHTRIKNDTTICAYCGSRY